MISAAQTRYWWFSRSDLREAFSAADPRPGVIAVYPIRGEGYLESDEEDGEEDED